MFDMFYAFNTKLFIKYLLSNQCHFEAANLAAAVGPIKENNLREQMGLVTCETADVYISETVWENASAILQYFQWS